MGDTLPDWLEPMAATLTQDRFTGPEWIFERKYDGIRLLAFKDGRDVRLLSRNRLERPNPAIAKAIADLPVHDVILDGESAWDGGASYHVFDILWLDGKKVTTLPLHERQPRAADAALETQPDQHDPLAARHQAQQRGQQGALA